MTDAPTPAQIYAGAIGAALALVGVLGFFSSAAFGTPGETDEVLGVLSVNGWHNVVHLSTGLLGMACAPRRRLARSYSLLLGVVYLAVVVWGFAIGSGESILGFLPINTADNWLHVALAALGLGAYVASHEASTTASRLA